MKYLLIGTALVAAGLGAAWYGGENWLSGKAREAVAASPVVEVASVAPLRDPGRIGLRMAGVEIGDDQNGLSAPDLDVFVPLGAPTTMTVTLPPQMALRLGAVPMTVTMTKGQAHAAISPTHEMALNDLGVNVQGLGLDGVEILQSLDVNAELTHMGPAAPPGSRAAYAIGIMAQGMLLGTLPDRLDVSGPLQVWLNEVPGQAMLEGRAPPPALIGAQTGGLRFTLGEAEATLIGRVRADSQGYAEGEAAVYTADSRRFVDAAVQAGFVPAEAAMLVGAVINNLSETPVPGQTEAATSAATPDRDAASEPIVTLPPPKEGQIRVPLILKGGEILLGTVPIGPAPRLIPG